MAQLFRKYNMKNRKSSLTMRAYEYVKLRGPLFAWEMSEKLKKNLTEAMRKKLVFRVRLLKERHGNGSNNNIHRTIILYYTHGQETRAYFRLKEACPAVVSQNKRNLLKCLHIPYRKTSNGYKILVEVEA